MHFLELILKVMFEFTLDIIYKSSRIAKVFLQKSLKLNSGYKNYFFTLMVVLILSPLVANHLLKKQSYKQSIFWTNGFSCVKMIFILLTKMVAIYLRFLLVYVWQLSLKRLFFWFCQAKILD